MILKMNPNALIKPVAEINHKKYKENIHEMNPDENKKLSIFKNKKYENMKIKEVNLIKNRQNAKSRLNTERYSSKIYPYKNSDININKKRYRGININNGKSKDLLSFQINMN